MQPGQIIYTTCSREALPCRHMAVVVPVEGVLHALHCTPSMVNSEGGNVVLEPLHSFLQSRTVNGMGPLTDSEKALQYAYNNRKRTWHGFAYNCEDFVNELHTGQRKSELRNAWIGVAASVLLL